MMTSNNIVRNLFIASIVLNATAIILNFMAEEDKQSSKAIERIENKYYLVVPPDRSCDTTMTYKERMYYESLFNPKY